jgi:hypothetical protein
VVFAGEAGFFGGGGGGCVAGGEGFEDAGRLELGAGEHVRAADVADLTQMGQRPAEPGATHGLHQLLRRQGVAAAEVEFGKAWVVEVGEEGGEESALGGGWGEGAGCLGCVHAGEDNRVLGGCQGDIRRMSGIANRLFWGFRSDV